MRTRAFAAIAGLAVLLTPAVSRADPARADRVVIVVLDQVRVEDMLGIPAVQHLTGSAAFGLLSTAGRGVVTPFVGALSISAGARAVAPDPVSHFLTIPPGPVTERLQVGTVGQAYSARTGRPAPPPIAGGTPFVYPDIQDVQQANAAGDVRAVPGTLGEVLARAGRTIAVASFTDPAAARLAPLLVMDGQGIVPWGILMDRRNPAAAGAAIGLALTHGDVVAIDGGGLATATTILPQVFKRLGPNDALLVLAADPPREVSREHTWLSPILALGPGIVPGVLASTSTRRSGVVSNVDILPTVLDWAGVTPPGDLVGQPITSVAEANPVAGVDAAYTRYARLSAQRGVVFRVLSLLTIVAMGVAAAGASRRGRLPFGVRALLLAAASGPLVMLLEPVVGSSNPAVTVGVVVGGALLMGTAFAFGVRRDRVAFATVGGISLALLAVDALTGSRLGAASLLGFTVAGGTRFYGLASEEMGVALAGLFLLLALVVDDRPRLRWFAYAGAGGLVVVFAAPPFGAKFGMLLTAVPALAIAWTIFEGRRVTRETVLLTVAVLIAGIGTATAAGLLAGSHGSHIGIETRVVGQAGAGAAISVLLRRAAVALKLLLTFWAWLVAGALAALALVAIPRRERLRAALRDRPGVRGGIAGLATAGAAALLFNDAGAVIAATMVMVAGPAVMAQVASVAGASAEPERPRSARRRSSSSATSSPTITGVTT